MMYAYNNDRSSTQIFRLKNDIQPAINTSTKIEVLSIPSTTV